MAKQKKSSEFIKELNLKTPPTMNYYVPISTDKDKDRFVKRVERIVRSSMEYRSYIQYLKENIGLDSCIFFQKVTSNRENGGSRRISIEIHHEPLTLYDIVRTVVDKYIDTGLPINDLLIADEVLCLHYENKVGLVPLSKTAHQMIHNSTKLSVPLNMCYGNYEEFLEEYEPWIQEEIYDKIERKVKATEELTMESFDALVKEFTYINVDGFDDVKKVEQSTDKKESEKVDDASTAA